MTNAQLELRGPRGEEHSSKDRFVTISVDDGHPTDLRTVELLNKYGLKATFYIPGVNHERALMSPAQIREVEQQFEVGSHCLNHVRLTLLTPEKARQEIRDGKKFSEDTVGHEVVSFCYPGGKCNSRLEAEVKKAGFLAARTCMYFLNDFPANPFRWGVSVYANNYPVYVQMRHALLELNFQGCYKYVTTFKARTRWGAQFQRALEDVSRNGGVAHLYFHSWEIDQNGEWDELERMFKAVAQYRLTPATNGELFRRWHEQRGLVTYPIPA